MTANRAAVIHELCACAREGQWARLEAPLRSGRLSLGAIVRAACASLERPSHHAIKFLAFHMLEALAEPLVLEDGQSTRLTHKLSHLRITAPSSLFG